MPNTSSAKKALRQNTKRRLHNRMQRSALRTAVKKARAAADGEPAAAQEALREVTRKLDQAAAKKLIHKNAAARTKSRLARLIQSKTVPAQS